MSCVACLCRIGADLSLGCVRDFETCASLQQRCSQMLVRLVECGLMLLASRVQTEKVVYWCDLCAFSIFPPSTTLENEGEGYCATRPGQCASSEGDACISLVSRASGSRFVIWTFGHRSAKHVKVPCDCRARGCVSASTGKISRCRAGFSVSASTGGISRATRDILNLCRPAQALP